MNTITLRYDFGQEDLDENGVFDADEKKKALQCKSLDDLADYIIDNDEDQAESIVESDEDFIENYIEEDLKEENEDDAYDAYQDATDGCDPDGFYGWGDYWNWKNG